MIKNKKEWLALGISLFAASPGRAAVPPQFSVQGVLRDGSGRLMSMPAHVTVSFYDASEGGNLVAGPFGPIDVPAQNGLFTAVIPAPDLKANLAGSAGRSTWMEIVEGSTIFARQPLTSEIFALTAQSAEQADALSPACSGCVSDVMIGGVAAGKIQGKVATATNADAVTNGLYSTMRYADPVWLSSLDGAKIVGNVANASFADAVKDGVYTTSVYANPGFVGSLDGAKIEGRITSATIMGDNVIGQVGSAYFCGTAFALVNGVYTSVKYADPAWITSLGGGKIEGPVADSAALGGTPAAGYQRAITSACAAGSYVAGVAQDGTVTCGAGAVTATGSDFGHALHPNGDGVIAHLTLSAPSAGFLVVTASFDATADNMGNGSPTACRVESRLDATGRAPIAGPGYQSIRFPATPTRDGDGNVLALPGMLTTRIRVNGPGPVSVYLNGASDCSSASWSDMTMTAVFEPAADATIGFSTP